MFEFAIRFLTEGDYFTKHAPQLFLSICVILGFIAVGCFIYLDVSRED